MNPIGITSLEELKEQTKLANNGDPIALYRLGNTYLSGVTDLIERDVNLGLQLLQQSGKKGSAEAYRDIGDHHKTNHNLEESFQWYMRAAEMGDSLSQWEVAFCYESGTGVTQDLSQAVRWYRESAIGGDERSKHNLGILYLFGEGVEKNEKLALKLFNEAAEGGIPEAYYHLGLLHLKQQSIVKARVALEIAAKLDVPAAQYNLALLYSNPLFGRPGERCKWQAEAVKWLEKAATSLPQANQQLANRYLYGQGTNVDLEKGVTLLKESVQKEQDPESLLSLATFHALGIGTAQDLSVTKKYLREILDKSGDKSAADPEILDKFLTLPNDRLVDELSGLWMKSIHPNLFSGFQERQIARKKHFHNRQTKSVEAIDFLSQKYTPSEKPQPKKRMR